MTQASSLNSVIMTHSYLFVFLCVTLMSADSLLQKGWSRIPLPYPMRDGTNIKQNLCVGCSKAFGKGKNKERHTCVFAESGFQVNGLRFPPCHKFCLMFV